jgi:hypothetical protein
MGRRRRSRLLPLGLLLAAGSSGGSPAIAGHESAFYPSFYPQDIAIQAVGPQAAGALLQKDALHVYVGANPFGGRPLPGEMGAPTSFHSFLVVTFNPAAAPARDATARCTAARHLVESARGIEEGVARAPYPVTPYHPDYLDHFDRIQSWQRAPYGVPVQRAADLRLRLKALGGMAERVARAYGPPADREWDATLEEVEGARLVSPPAVGLHGWLGPPWMKEGWYQAYHLLSGAVRDTARRERIQKTYRQLVDGDFANATDQVNLQRTLVALLTQGCERAVLGYTVRRTVFNDHYSGGVEHVTLDSLAGALSSILIRTVKLKDFPWNGFLKLGVEASPGATAWNPVGGFTDPMGRLTWFAAGDPAMFPAPASGSWVANRVTAAVTPRASMDGRVEVPPDALLPEAGTGALREVGQGTTARAKVVYKIPLSQFHDGTRTTIADLYYPYAFAFRWGVQGRTGGQAYDPYVDESTTLLRRWLAGFKLRRTEHFRRTVADVNLEWQVPVIEVYLRHTALDPQQAAAVAPPWSSVPWHVLALMEEAVARGAAAFSEAEARRRGVKWLDLVRDPALQATLTGYVDEFERAGYVPAALKDLVASQEAKQRWAALRQFARNHHHFLVTNGPYRLQKWSEDAVDLKVFRDFTYPLGVGTFDPYALPPKASITQIVPKAGGLQIAADMEKPERAGRSYNVVRGRLTKDATVGGYPVEARCRYLAVAPDGMVLRAGAASLAGNGTFRLDLSGLPAGRYTILTAISLNGYAIHPEVKAVPYNAAR